MANDFGDFAQLKPWQVVNQFPGEECVTHKHRLLEVCCLSSSSLLIHLNNVTDCCEVLGNACEVVASHIQLE